MKLFGSKRSGQRSGGKPEKSGTPGGAAGGKKRKLSGTQLGVIILIASILALVGLVIGIYKIMVKPPDVANPPGQTEGKPNTNKVTVINDAGEEEEVEYDVPGSHKPGYYNILIVGTDGDGTRTDTIMIARMDTNDHTVALMSVPRDTLINASYSVPKINSVYGMNGKGEKGIAALRKQLTAILGFDVDGYVMIDLQAFMETVELIGGVTFNVPQRMYYNDPTQDLYIDLQKGEQTLNGKQAMGLVRFRSYAEGDIKRTEVQQNFMKALAKQCLTFGNITKIKPMIDIFIEYVDTDLTLGNMVYFAQELLNCDFENMKTYTLPGRGGVMINGGDHYALYPSQVLEIVNESFNPYDTDIPLSNLHIRTAGSSGGSSSGSSSKPSKPSTSNTNKPTTPSDSDDTPAETPGDTGTTTPDGGATTTPGTDGTDTNQPTTPAQPNDGPNGADLLDPTAPDGSTTTPDNGGAGGTTTPGNGGTGGTTTPGNDGTGGSTNPGTGGTGGATTPPANPDNGGNTTIPPVQTPQTDTPEIPAA